jgi:hypothetical protein
MVKFDKTELLKLISKASVDSVEALRKANRYCKTFRDILDPVCDYLIEKYGFKLVQYQETISVFGWASLFKKNDWKEERNANDDLSVICKAIKNSRGKKRSEEVEKIV